MSDLYPLVFHPIFKERVWGGRTLETLYGKPLPPAVPVGEAWEVSDRPGDESIVANGPLAGSTLRWLMTRHADALLGGARPAAGDRFPLLCKILDARDRLSLQVHPPTSEIGEPKTEVWYIARAEPGAELFVGLRRDVTRSAFAEAIRAGTVAECFHRVSVDSGDAMFLPSGRVHGIGAGLVIFEIQQNSDTTFRVFDWNRAGLDGKPRELHVAESLQSIDFSDVEPALVATRPVTSGVFEVRPLVRDVLFKADLVRARSAGTMELGHARLRIVGVTDEGIAVTGGGRSEALRPGQFAVVPASLAHVTVEGNAGAGFLLVEPG